MFSAEKKQTKAQRLRSGGGARSYEPQGAVRMERPRWGHGGAWPTTVASNTMLRNLDFILQAGGGGALEAGGQGPGLRGGSN